jgi:hypothetical protein
MVREPERRPHLASQVDAARIGVDSDDLTTGVHLTEVRRKEPETAPNVQDTPFIRKQQIHYAEELRPENREANVRIGSLDRRKGSCDVPDGGAPKYFGCLEPTRSATGSAPDLGDARKSLT